MFKGKKILIIGASGTLGQVLIEEFLRYDIHSIRVFSRNEHKQFLLRQKYGEPTNRIRYFLGDIRDKERLDMAFNSVDIVVNAAALKHVSLCNENPMETLKTNVIGVQNALECAVKNNIELFVQISTDKAVNPTNIYGCSKAMAEYLVLDAPNFQGNNRTKFIVARSGNIKNSSGSVLQIWDYQKSLNVPLTVTDLSAVRYMAEKEKIAQAIIKVIREPYEGLVVLNMPKYTVKDLLKPYGDYPINIIGLQKGEKKEEILFNENEVFTLVEV